MQTKLIIDGQEQLVEVLERSPSHVVLEWGGQSHRFDVHQQNGGVLVLRDAEGHLLPAFVGQKNADGIAPVWVDGVSLSIGKAWRRRAGGDDVAGKPVAPLTGMVCEVLVAEGDVVEKGAALVVMEAMKMQMTISAAQAGTITAVHVAVGAQVSEGTELVSLEVSDAA